MAQQKRLVITVTQSIESELDVAKRENYYGKTQNDMIKDLIIRGLASLKSEAENPHNPPKQTA